MVDNGLVPSFPAAPMPPGTGGPAGAPSIVTDPGIQAGPGGTDAKGSTVPGSGIGAGDAESSGYAPDHAPRLDLDETIAFAHALQREIARVVIGTPEAVSIAVLAVLSGAHLLIEDVPGVGKTVLAKALASVLGARLQRIQGHPDLLPSDVTGVSIYNPGNTTWEFRPGPIFSPILLVDELNRTPPRTQSALLEAMEEGQVTVDGESWQLPYPHLVIATQNPLSQLGTYPLVESQLDRFGLATTMGYPDATTEVALALHYGGQGALQSLAPLATPGLWERVQWATATLPVSETVATYAVELCRATRAHPAIRLGASPRAAIALVRAAQAHALLGSRRFTTPDDVKAVVVPALAHRLVAERVPARSVLEELMTSTPTPRP